MTGKAKQQTWALALAAACGAGSVPAQAAGSTLFSPYVHHHHVRRSVPVSLYLANPCAPGTVIAKGRVDFIGKVIRNHNIPYNPPYFKGTISYQGVSAHAANSGRPYRIKLLSNPNLLIAIKPPRSSTISQRILFMDQPSNHPFIALAQTSIMRRPNGNLRMQVTGLRTICAQGRGS